MNVTQADRHRREAIIADHSAPHKHVFILATADGCGTAEIMCRSARSVAMAGAVHDRGRRTAEPAVDVKSLHAKIGELTLENNS